MMSLIIDQKYVPTRILFRSFSLHFVYDLQCFAQSDRFKFNQKFHSIENQTVSINSAIHQSSGRQTAGHNGPQRPFPH